MSVGTTQYLLWLCVHFQAGTDEMLILILISIFTMIWLKGQPRIPNLNILHLISSVSSFKPFTFLSDRNGATPPFTPCSFHPSSFSHWASLTLSLSLPPFTSAPVWSFTEWGWRIGCPAFLPSPVKFQSQATVKGGIVYPWGGMPLHCSSKERIHLARNLEASWEI